MLKELLEKRAELIEKMEKITSLVETEKRAMNEAEMTDFQSTETEIRGLDDTIEALQRARQERQEVRIPLRWKPGLLRTLFAALCQNSVRIF